MVFIFFAGIFAAAALIIPGISGSFVLLLLGVYHPAIYSLSSIRFFLGDITNLGLMLDICRVLVPLGLGIIIGILSMARLIEKLLKKYSGQVYLVMLGLLGGSVFVMFKSPMVYSSGISTMIVIIGAAAFILGSVMSFVIGKRRF